MGQPGQAVVEQGDIVDVLLDDVTGDERGEVGVLDDVGELVGR